MDIWDWFHGAAKAIDEVEPGLGMRLQRLPSLVVDARNDAVDAAVPELLAAVQRARHPWLEVYVRHWHLQSLVFHRSDVRRGLPEAVALIERAHRPDAAQCPQTVCASQDLCAAYGFADGPGWATERIQVAEETLERIDPSWACWVCINSEKVSGLVDKGEPEVALECAAAAVDRMVAAGETPDGFEFVWDRVRALALLGRHEEALQLASRAEGPHKGDSYQVQKRAEMALLLAQMGRFDDALAKMPPWDLVVNQARLFTVRAETLELLVRHDAQKWDADVASNFVDMVRTLLDRGAARSAIDVAVCGAAAAAHAGTKAFGLALLELGASGVPALRLPLDAEERLSKAEQDLNKAVSGGEVSERPYKFSQLDDALAHAKQPDEVAEVASLWIRLGLPQRGISLLAGVAAAHPDDGYLYLVLGQALLNASDDAALTAHLARFPDPAAPGDCPGQAAWLSALRAAGQGDRAAAIAHLDQLLAARPQWCSAAVPRLLSRLHLEARDHGAALVALEATLEREPAPGPADWERLLAASWVDRWDVVRDSAKRLMLNVEPGEGPIDGNYGLVRLSYDEPTLRRPVWALRTGPVTARIVQIVGPGIPERYGDEVLFKPLRLDDPSEDGTPLYKLDGTKQAAGLVSFAIDGVHPGAEVVETLKVALDACNARAQVTSSDDYHVSHDDDVKPGLYLRVAHDKADHIALIEALRPFRHLSLTWLVLAAADGDAAELARQRAVALHWGLT